MRSLHHFWMFSTSSSILTFATVFYWRNFEFNFVHKVVLSLCILFISKASSASLVYCLRSVSFCLNVQFTSDLSSQPFILSIFSFSSRFGCFFYTSSNSSFGVHWSFGFLRSLFDCCLYSFLHVNPNFFYICCLDHWPFCLPFAILYSKSSSFSFDITIALCCSEAFP